MKTIPNHADKGAPQSIVLCPEDNALHHALTSPIHGARFCGKCMAVAK